MSKKLSKSIKDTEIFLNKTETHLSITNHKGTWLARVTKKHVQIMLVTGKDLIELHYNLAMRCEDRSKELGI